MRKNQKTQNQISLQLLPKEAIFEYQQAYKNFYGKDISFEKAISEGSDLFNTFRAVYKPIKKEWVKQLANKGFGLEKKEKKSL